jgi:hypothetical protein
LCCMQESAHTSLQMPDIRCSQDAKNNTRLRKDVEMERTIV